VQLWDNGHRCGYHVPHRYRSKQNYCQSNKEDIKHAALLAGIFLRGIDSCFQKVAGVVGAATRAARKREFKDSHLYTLGYPASDSLVAEGFGKSLHWRKKAHKQPRAAVKPTPMVPKPVETLFEQMYVTPKKQRAKPPGAPPSVDCAFYGAHRAGPWGGARGFTQDWATIPHK
jgi:hypothetical protein